MRQWIKLSAGVHKDRKLWKLSKDAQLVFFYLLSIAGSEDRNGFLPSAEDIALELWFLKLKPKELSSALLSLAEAGIIEETQTDEIKLTNFEKWQTSEKTKSEIDHEYYIRNKKRKTENPLNLSEIQSNIQTELSEQSAEIPMLDKDIDKDIDINSFSNEKELKTRAKKSAYGSMKNVMLTDDEYAKLKSQFVDADEKIEAMSLYFGSHGNAGKYKSHYATALNWARMAKERDAGKPKAQSVNEYPDIYTQLKAEGVI